MELKQESIPTSDQVCKNYLSVSLSSFYSESLLPEADNLYEQKQNQLLQKTGEKLLFLHLYLLKR